MKKSQNPISLHHTFSLFVKKALYHQDRNIEDVEYSQLKVEKIGKSLAEIFIILDDEVYEDKASNESHDEEKDTQDLDKHHVSRICVDCRSWVGKIALWLVLMFVSRIPNLNHIIYVHSKYIDKISINPY